MRLLQFLISDMERLKVNRIFIVEGEQRKYFVEIAHGEIVWVNEPVNGGRFTEEECNFVREQLVAMGVSFYFESA